LKLNFWKWKTKKVKFSLVFFKFTNFPQKFFQNPVSTFQNGRIATWSYPSCRCTMWRRGTRRTPVRWSSSTGFPSSGTAGASSSGTLAGWRIVSPLIFEVLIIIVIYIP
jgi:hypothetical protein